jgi:hypothetical protein
MARMQPRQTEAPSHTAYHNSFPHEGALPISGVFPSIPSGTFFEKGNGVHVRASELRPRTFFEKPNSISVRASELLPQFPRSKRVDLSPL